MKCLFCDKGSITTKYIVNPSYVIVPSAYNLCKDHEQVWLKYEDIYNEDGSRKPIPIMR